MAKHRTVDVPDGDDDFTVAELARATTLAGITRRLPAELNGPWVYPDWWPTALEERAMGPAGVLALFADHEPDSIRRGRQILENAEEFRRTNYGPDAPWRKRQ